MSVRDCVGVANSATAGRPCGGVDCDPDDADEDPDSTQQLSNPSRFFGRLDVLVARRVVTVPQRLQDRARAPPRTCTGLGCPSRRVARVREAGGVVAAQLHEAPQQGRGPSRPPRTWAAPGRGPAGRVERGNGAAECAVRNLRIASGPRTHAVQARRRESRHRQQGTRNEALRWSGPPPGPETAGWPSSMEGSIPVTQRAPGVSSESINFPTSTLGGSAARLIRVAARRGGAAARVVQAEAPHPPSGFRANTAGAAA
jgi:hypothetical protein